MTAPALFLGIDGGGTKTEFLCLDQGGAIVAGHVGATTYHPQVGVEGVSTVLAEGIAAVCRAIDGDPQRFAHVFFGLPAYGEDSRIDPELAALCGRLLGHDRYGCGNDMICGWAGSLACRDGINIVAGTGSIGYGERQGRTARTGGWGEIFSDEGSAYWIAVQGLNRFSRMSDGRLPKGPLHDAFSTALDLPNDLDICARIMGPTSMTRDQIAGLARIVDRAAEDGDAVARDILAAAGDQLFALAEALRIQLGFADAEPVPMSRSGGVLSEFRLVRERFEAAATAAQAQYQLVAPLHRPAYGAALYAMHLSSNSRRSISARQP